MRKPHRDYAAGEYVFSLREDKGLSRGDFVKAMQLANPDDARMQVSERTLVRVEEEGVVPTTRVKFAIAAQLGMVPSQIWGAARSRLAA